MPASAFRTHPPGATRWLSCTCSWSTVRLISPDSGTFRYLVGLWYLRSSLDRYYLRGIYGIKPTNYTNYETTSRVQNAAIYANSTWELLPNHTLTLGGRFSHGSSSRSDRQSLSSLQMTSGSQATPPSQMTTFKPGNRSKTPWQIRLIVFPWKTWLSAECHSV